MSRMRLHSEHFDTIISVKWQSVSARHRIPIENTTMMVDRRTSKETDWDQKRNEEGCKRNSASVSAYAKLLLEGRWTFLGSGDEEKWYGTLSFKPCRKWNSTAEEMMRNVAESGHPAFRCPNQFSSDVLKSRGGEVSSIHYNADPKTVELLLKTIIAVNQLSVFGAVAKWCNNNSLDETVGSQDSSFFRNSRFEGLCLVRCDAEMS